MVASVFFSPLSSSSFYHTPRCHWDRKWLSCFLISILFDLIISVCWFRVAFWLVLARCFLQTCIKKICSIIIIIIIIDYLRPLNNQWVFKWVYGPNGFILLRLPSKILTQMEASRTCVLWVSVKAVREEGMGNGEHDLHHGIISWLISGA